MKVIKEFQGGRIQHVEFDSTVMRVFNKDWGKEIWVDTLDDLIKYLKNKGLNFIIDKLKKDLEGCNLDKIKEFCITENKNGFVLEVGSCLWHDFSYRSHYKVK